MQGSPNRIGQRASGWLFFRRRGLRLGRGRFRWSSRAAPLLRVAERSPAWDRGIPWARGFLCGGASS
ncbi:hypothetical protein HMPREF1861_02231 [Corynebacterium kroppenstedtii]|nr:hypothetical protein HMPREF1861_02231 [Corynebacterium kroppenstedtii]